jgi:hypothetical protein
LFQPPTDWIKFAKAEYDVLAAEETDGQDNDDDEGQDDSEDYTSGRRFRYDDEEDDDEDGDEAADVYDVHTWTR